MFLQVDAKSIPSLPIAILQCPAPFPPHLPHQGYSAWMGVMMNSKERAPVPVFSCFPKLVWMLPPWTGQGQSCLHVSLSPWNFSHSPSYQGLSSQSVSVICDDSKQSSLLMSPNLALDVGKLGSQHDWLWKLWVETGYWIMAFLLVVVVSALSQKQKMLLIQWMGRYGATCFTAN